MKSSSLFVFQCDRTTFPLASNSCNSARLGWTRSAQKFWVCQTCQSQFSSKLGLDEHENVHRRVRPHRCDQCKVEFNRGSTVCNHQRSHAAMHDRRPSLPTAPKVTPGQKRSTLRITTDYRETDTSAIAAATDEQIPRGNQPVEDLGLKLSLPYKLLRFEKLEDLQLFLQQPLS